MAPEDFRAQIETTLFGPVNVTRAALPQMRAQRSGLVVTISSTAGIASTGDFLTAYAASKFGVEGFMEALTTEIAPFGIKTMLVEPGFFRTELLSPQSTSYAEPSIDDYAERTRATVAAWQGMDGQQGGDPAKLADALVQLVALDEPPAAVRRRRRRRRALRDQGPDPPRPGRRPPRALQQPRPLRRLSPNTPVPTPLVSLAGLQQWRNRCRNLQIGRHPPTHLAGPLLPIRTRRPDSETYP